jgi:hypothetical protein
MQRPVAPPVPIATSASQALTGGSLAALLSTAALALAGRHENGSAAAPINAISHWYWGDEALHRQRADAAHTVAGYATHHAASLFWAGLLAWATRSQPALRTRTGLVLGSIATSALACFVDFQLTPKRFTPGYEHRLSKTALAGVYAVFAVGLAVGALAVQAGSPRGEPPGRSSAHRRSVRR